MQTCSDLQNRWGEAAQKLAELLNDDTFRSLEGKSKHQVCGKVWVWVQV